MYNWLASVTNQPHCWLNIKLTCWPFLLILQSLDGPHFWQLLSAFSSCPKAFLSFSAMASSSPSSSSASLLSRSSKAVFFPFGAFTGFFFVTACARSEFMYYINIDGESTWQHTWITMKTWSRMIISIGTDWPFHLTSVDATSSRHPFQSTSVHKSIGFAFWVAVVSLYKIVGFQVTAAHPMTS